MASSIKHKACIGYLCLQEKGRDRFGRLPLVKTKVVRFNIIRVTV